MLVGQAESVHILQQFSYVSCNYNLRSAFGEEADLSIVVGNAVVFTHTVFFKTACRTEKTNFEILV